MPQSKVPSRFGPYTLGQTNMANAQSVAIASDQSAIPISGGQSTLASGSWTSATALNTAVTLNTANLNTVSIGIVATTTFTGGVVTFEVSPDGTNYFPVAVARINAYTVETTYTFVASTAQAWSTSVDAFISFRVRLSTVITGTGTATVLVQGQAFAIEPIVTVGQSDGTKLLTTIVPPTLTKGTQGATGLTTQDLKDAGRTSLIFSNTAQATGTTGVEAMVTLLIASGTGAATSGTTYNIPAGKTLRITAISFAQIGNATATQATTTFRLRLNTGGAVVATSTPILLQCRVVTPATTLAFGRFDVPVGEGYEIIGGATVNIGVSVNSVFVTNAPTVDVSIVGYLY